MENTLKQSVLCWKYCTVRFIWVVKLYFDELLYSTIGGQIESIVQYDFYGWWNWKYYTVRYVYALE